jgi:uncharacterized protein
MSPAPENLQPTAAAQRVSVIDSLRGFAIFGILVVNVLYFFGSWYTPAIREGAPAVDTVVKFVTNTFFVSKFFTLFSFLFGLGMYIQMSRAQAKGAPFLPVYLRRLLILALFGLAHAIFLWVGDILFLYAILGLVAVLLFRNRKPRTLLVWAIILIMLPIAFITLSTGMIELARSAPPETGAYAQVEESFAEQREFLSDRADRGADIYGSGSYGEVTRWRANEFFFLLFSSNIFMAPTVLAMFLLGLRAGKEGWFTDIEGNVLRFRRFLRWGLPTGLLLNLVVGFSNFDLNTLGSTVLTWRDVLLVASLGLGSVLLSLSYVVGITLWSRTDGGSRALAPLAPVGRMALSNYIMHSIVMSTLAYGYGAGLYGRIDLWVGFLLAVLLYLLQIPLSSWWFRRFRFGPLEWVWRVLTYGNLPRG